MSILKDIAKLERQLKKAKEKAKGTAKRRNARRDTESLGSVYYVTGPMRDDKPVGPFSHRNTAEREAARQRRDIKIRRDKV